MILFKGQKNTGNHSDFICFIGKTNLCISLINKFLNESEANRAVYVGLSKNKTEKLQSKVSQSSRLACFSLSKDETEVSDAEFLLTPK